MRSLALHRRANVSMMFAVFAAVLTLGVLSMAKPVKTAMVSAIHKSASIR